jgi:hypothetical protein
MGKSPIGIDVIQIVGFRNVNYYLQVYGEAMGNIKDTLTGIKAESIND